MNQSTLYSDPPPPGVRFDPSHITDRFVQACLSFGVCILISLLFICSRVYVKWRVTRMFALEDCKFHWIFGERG